LFATVGCGESMCGNTVLQDEPSSDGRRHVVVFTRDCGATTDFSTQVSILTRSRSVTDGGNVFIVDSDHGAVPTDSGRGPTVRAEWVNAHTVRVHYPAGARVFKQAARHDDTDILYAAEAIPASRP
jgi:hypothetical protein